MIDTAADTNPAPAHARQLSAALKGDVRDFIDDYANSIDEDRLEDWAEFFAEDCSYRIIARENFDEKLPLAIMRCESKNMLKDRVTAIRQTMTFAPRHVRHFISGVRCSPGEIGESLAVSANFCIAQSKVGAFSTLHCVGRYLGLVTRAEGLLRFRRLDCVFDTGLIDNSVIYPL